VEGVFFHDVTGRATWAAVTDGIGVAMVPLDRAEVDGQVLCLPYRVEQLAAAPRPAPGAHLDPDDEDALYRHYGLVPTATDAPAPPQPPTAPTPTDPAKRDPMDIVRSAEQLHTRVERRVYGRVRLVTYVVTENVTFTVPVSRQEVRLEPIPINGTDLDLGISVGELVEDEYEVVLHQEQISFTATPVPVERVRLVRHIVEGRQSLTAQLRSEQFDIEHTYHQVDTDGYAPAQPPNHRKR
jgi:uncharacterized protein (TIGR02271 family)